ncbi:MAG: galactokinase family protein [Vicinamibacterales bacterium]
MKRSRHGHRDTCAALVGRELDPRESAAKARLLGIATGQIRAVGGEPDGAWWVPGRLEIFGKHTDYAGGRTLVTAVPRGFIVAARRRGDNIVQAIDAVNGETATMATHESSGPTSGWSHYVATVVNRLARNFPEAPLGADIAFASDLPRAAGMSSSSALVVGVAQALVELSGIGQSPMWRAHVATPLDKASYFACIENGSRFESFAGDAGVGTHGGSEDHAAMIDARAGQVSAFAFVPPRAFGRAPMPGEWSFVVAASGIVAEKTGAARHAYNRLADGARALLDLWNGAGREAPSLAAALASASDAADRLRSQLRRSSVRGWTWDDLERRLDHFIREDARVEAALAAFAAADTRALDQLSATSQTDAERLLGNQVDETVALAADARHEGAFAACSFGAGFGGSVWALVEAGDAERFAARWHPSAFIARPGPPLTVL